MAKKNEFGFMAQKSDFNMVGTVQGKGGAWFLKESTTTKGKDARELRFNVKTNLQNNLPQVILKGYSDTELMVWKNEEKELLRVPFSQREEWIKNNKDDKNLSIINGVSIKLGDMEEVETLHVFDAIAKIADNISNDDTVRVIGTIDYSSYRDKKTGNVVSRKDFTIKRIYKSEVNMLDEHFIETSDFRENFIFQEINPCILTEEEKKEGEKPYFEVNGLNMGFKTLDKVNFRIYNPKLAKTLKKNVKEYTTMQATGNIVSRLITETVEEKDDGWGETAKSYQQTSKKINYMVITGVNKDSLDTETYPKADMEKILANQTFFGDEKPKDEFSDVKVDKKVEKEDDGWGFGTDGEDW